MKLSTNLEKVMSFHSVYFLEDLKKIQIYESLKLYHTDIKDKLSVNNADVQKTKYNLSITDRKLKQQRNSECIIYIYFKNLHTNVRFLGFSVQICIQSKKPKRLL